MGAKPSEPFTAPRLTENDLDSKENANGINPTDKTKYSWCSSKQKQTFCPLVWFILQNPKNNHNNHK